MKKVVLTIAVLGSIFLAGCEKDEALAPSEKVLFKAEKDMDCRGCGQWDKTDTTRIQSVSLRTAIYDGEPETVKTAQTFKTKDR